MRATLSLVAIVALVAPCFASQSTLDPRLEPRAREYFASLVAGDFARVWELTSPSVRDDTDYGRDAFIDRMTQMAAYDMSFSLKTGCSYESKGWIYLEMQIRQTKADVWETKYYEAQWVRVGDEWLIDSLTDIESLDGPLEYCNHPLPSPN